MPRKTISADIADSLTQFNQMTSFLDERKRQISEIALRKLLSDPDIDGVMIGGSLARGSHDRESDLDLIVSLTTDDDAEAQIQRMIAWAKQEGDFYEYSIARRLPFVGDLLTLFFHGLSFSIDMGFLGPERLANTELESYGTILLDRSQILRKHIKANHVPRLSRDYEEEIWINLWKVKKTLTRANYWRTNEHLNRARRAAVGLILTERGLPIHYRGREDHQIERMIDVSIFRDTWPSAHPHGYGSAAIALIHLTQEFNLTPRAKRLLSNLENELKEFAFASEKSE